MARLKSAPDITPYRSEILGELMFEGDEECYDSLLGRIITVADLAQTAINSEEDGTYDLDATFEKDVTVIPGQILFFLLEAKALPEYNLEEGDVKSFFEAVLISHNDYYQRTMQGNGLREAKEGLYLDADVAVETILSYSVAARLNHLNYSLGAAAELVYFPPTPLIKTDAARAKIEDGIKEVLTKTLLQPNTIADFKDHPDWLLICPPRMLKKSFLKTNPQFEAAVLEALGVIIFMRICAQMGFDDILTTKAFLPLWTRYFEEKKDAINNDNPALLQAIQTIWSYEGKGIPPSLLRILPAKAAPAQALASGTVARVSPIIESPEVNFSPSTQIDYRVEDTTISLKSDKYHEDSYLHVVVWEKSNSGNRRNPKFYCFDNEGDAFVPKSSNRFEITAFWCDKSEVFPNQKSLGTVPDASYCQINNITPREENPSEPDTVNNSTETSTYTIDTSSGQDPAMMAAAKKLAHELNWQEILALKLMECIDRFDEVFDEPVWQDENNVSFHVQGEGSQAYFTVQIEPLQLTSPDYEIVEDYLKEEALPMLITWAQAKKEQYDNDEKLKKDRQEVADWRQANPFRQAKGTACRKALSFRPWEDYQSGTHKGPQGLEIPLYAWDKACVRRTYIPKIKHLLAQLEKAGMKTSYDKALLESQGQRDVVLDQINFEIPETGLKFSLKINREAESSSEIFQLEFDDSTPDPWRNEAARWAIGTVCMMGIITLPKDKSPLVDGKTDRPNDVSHFSFKADPKRRRNSKEQAESTSSYGNIVTRLNQGRGRVKSIANGRGFDWNASWADFSDAGQAVFQNAFFREDSRCDAAGSQADYELILKDERWQKYAVLRLWKTLKLDQKIGDLTHRSSIGPYSKNMTAVLEKAWKLMSKEEQSAFISIDSPTAAAEFTFKHGESKNVNFIRTLVSMWQASGIGLHIQKEPVYVTFDTVAQHCQSEGKAMIANTQEDLDVLKELGLPDLKIKKAF